MGNCQAVDTASLVIQHPSGKVERFYWPLSASEVMKTNPGHYVALVLTFCLPPSDHKHHKKEENKKEEENKLKEKHQEQHHHHQRHINNTTTKNNNNNNNNNNNEEEVRITRVKVLRPTDTLVLGQAYRLVTSQEVMKGLWARKYAKMKKDKVTTESTDKPLLRPRPKQQSSTSSVCETESISSQLVDKPPNQVQVAKHERHRPRTPSAAAPSGSAASTRSRMWRPSLQSISEAER